MSKDKKTLIILTPGFAANEADTTCIPMQQSFIKALKQAHPDLTIIILAFQYPYTKNRYSFFGNTVIPFCGRDKGGLSMLFLRQKIYAALKEIHASNGIASILSFWYGECALVGKRFADKYGIKHCCWIWGQDAKKNNKHIKNIRLKADELVVFSDFLQNEFEKDHGIRPHAVVPPGIHAKEFGDLPGEKDIDILGAGSLIPLKQYTIFVEIVAEIKKQKPDIKAMLIGNGPEKDRLQYLIKDYGLESNVTLAGELSHPVVLQCMQRTKVFLHTSSYEGFGVVCIEALYGGAHVVSFIKPVAEDIKNWHIVNNKDEMKLKALNILLSPATNYESTTVYTINDTVQKMMACLKLN